MAAQWVDIGVGGALALLVIREVLNFLKTQRHRNNKPPVSSGDRSTEFWTTGIDAIIEERIKPVLENQQRLSDKFEKICDTITAKIDAIPSSRHVLLEKVDRIMEEILRQKRGNT